MVSHVLMHEDISFSLSVLYLAFSLAHYHLYMAPGCTNEPCHFRELKKTILMSVVIIQQHVPTACPPLPLTLSQSLPFHLHFSVCVREASHLI